MRIDHTLCLSLQSSHINNSDHFFPTSEQQQQQQQHMETLAPSYFPSHIYNNQYLFEMVYPSTNSTQFFPQTPQTTTIPPTGMFYHSHSCIVKLIFFYQLKLLNYIKIYRSNMISEQEIEVFFITFVIS